MTADDGHDASADSLDPLATLAPDRARAELVRARCRMHLVRSRRRATRAAEISGVAWHVAGPIVFGAFCVFYTALLMATTVEIEGIFGQ
jgi:hypothetical protein